MNGNTARIHAGNAARVSNKRKRAETAGVTSITRKGLYRFQLALRGRVAAPHEHHREPAGRVCLRLSDRVPCAEVCESAKRCAQGTMIAGVQLGLEFTPSSRTPLTAATTGSRSHTKGTGERPLRAKHRDIRRCRDPHTGAMRCHGIGGVPARRRARTSGFIDISPLAVSLQGRPDQFRTLSVERYRRTKIPQSTYRL